MRNLGFKYKYHTLKIINGFYPLLYDNQRLKLLRFRLIAKWPLFIQGD